MRAVINMVGQVFTRLTVVERAESKSRHAAWLCVCLCGKAVTVDGSDLRKGTTRSCGCLKRELSAKTVRSAHAALRKHKTDEERIAAQAASTRLSNARGREKLSDSYVRDLLSRQFGCKPSEVPEGLLPLKREAMANKRALKQLTKALADLSQQGQEQPATQN